MNLFIYKLKRISLIRIILYPLIKFFDIFAKIKYRKSPSYVFFKSCKNMHKGKRCFIIGNGPSLLPEDLDLLKNEITFAFNRIYYIFDQTEWRPTYYMCTDREILSANYKAIKELDLDNKLISRYARKYIGDDESVKYMMMDRVMLPKKYRMKNISLDISERFSPVPTVACSAMELAIYMGFKEIYLLGMDNNYNIKKAEGVDVVDSDSYFKGMKQENVTIGKGDTKEIRDQFYQVFRTEALKYGVKILNATRGGMLDVFDRVCFDDIMKH